MLVIILLGVMVLILMTVNYLVMVRDGHADPKDEERLRRQLRAREKMLTRENLFHKFLARDRVKN